MDWKIELILIPVTDIDRSRDFYASLGWHVDFDHVVSDEIRFVQITPPGSACSVAFGKGISEMQPGSLQAIQIVVASADEAKAVLDEQGIEAQGPVDLDWGRFVNFRDPDGNGIILQQLPPRPQA